MAQKRDLILQLLWYPSPSSWLNPSWLHSLTTAHLTLDYWHCLNHSTTIPPNLQAQTKDQTEDKEEEETVEKEDEKKEEPTLGDKRECEDPVDEPSPKKQKEGEDAGEKSEENEKEEVTKEVDTKSDEEPTEVTAQWNKLRFTSLPFFWLTLLLDATIGTFRERFTCLAFQPKFSKHWEFYLHPSSNIDRNNTFS